MQESASAITTWPVILRVRKELCFNRIVKWDDCGHFYVEFDITDHGRLCRNIVIEDGPVRLVEDCDT